MYLDADRETVFIPINQVPVPFHISTIKTVSLSEMGFTHALRFNFHTSAQRTLGKDAARNMVHYVNQSRDYMFIKEISIKVGWLVGWLVGGEIAGRVVFASQPVQLLCSFRCSHHACFCAFVLLCCCAFVLCVCMRARVPPPRASPHRPVSFADQSEDTMQADQGNAKGQPCDAEAGVLLRVAFFCIAALASWQ